MNLPILTGTQKLESFLADCYYFHITIHFSAIIPWNVSTHDRACISKLGEHYAKLFSIMFHKRSTFENKHLILHNYDFLTNCTEGVLLFIPVYMLWNKSDTLIANLSRQLHLPVAKACLITNGSTLEKH